MIETQASKLRQSFLDDPSRPIYHFLPPSNWMNDPNGLIQWQGKYHLFYQHNPDEAIHRQMHWGHAVSDDLIHWDDLPVALAPTPGTLDGGGIFSGCAINHNGTATIFYTGVNEGNTAQVQFIATSSDNLLNTWQKYDGNPIIKDVPVEANQTSDFRDPFVWKEDETWYMLVGSEIAGQGGVVFLYQSDDAINWDYMHPLYSAEEDGLGNVWECPNFFKLDDKWVLIVSISRNDKTSEVVYFVGQYENHRFIPETMRTLDHAYLYAPLTIEDDNGRRLLWGWIREGRSEEAYATAGWAGVQSIPRVLSLDEHNNLLTEPVPELEAIRRENTHLSDFSDNDSFNIETKGLALDIVAQFEVNHDSTITFSLACSADGNIGTEIRYNATLQRLTVNREKSSNNPEDEHSNHSVEHHLYEGETLDLRILLDASVIEIIANKRTSITTRIYPTDFAHNFLRLSGNDTILKRLDIYEMPSIWSLETG